MSMTPHEAERREDVLAELIAGFEWRERERRMRGPRPVLTGPTYRRRIGYRR